MLAAGLQAGRRAASVTASRTEGRPSAASSRSLPFFQVVRLRSRGFYDINRRLISRFLISDFP